LQLGDASGHLRAALSRFPDKPWWSAPVAPSGPPVWARRSFAEVPRFTVTPRRDRRMAVLAGFAEVDLARRITNPVGINFRRFRC
jgi:hypothetical protein